MFKIVETTGKERRMNGYQPKGKAKCQAPIPNFRFDRKPAERIVVDYEALKQINYRDIQNYTMVDNWLNIRTSRSTIHINLDKVMSVSIYDEETEE